MTDSDSKTVDATSIIDCDQQESDNCKEKDDEDDDEETQDAWLESLGIENSEIKKINHSQVCINIVHSQFDLILRTVLGKNNFGERK